MEDLEKYCEECLAVCEEIWMYDDDVVCDEDADDDECWAEEEVYEELDEYCSECEALCEEYFEEE